MKWNHLPGGNGTLGQQNPDLLDRWKIIFMERATAQEEERIERERKSKASANAKGGRRMAGRSPRR